jgi:hypothetical protein
VTFTEEDPMQRALRAAGWTLAAAVLTTACGDSGREADFTGGRDAAPAAAPATAERPGPDTTASAVWAFLREEDYRENWRLWPGKDRLYPGTEPHGMLLTTYVNPAAYDALQGGRVEDLPPGSIIVKENWMPDSTFDAATVMYRVDGYNPDHEDWLFAKFDPQGNPDGFGRAPMCQSCHQNAETGYIYTAVQR